MSTMFADVPAVKEQDVEVQACSLVVERLGEAADSAAAWALLPVGGQGVVTLTDEVRRYDPAKPVGLLLTAEVAEGNSTWVVRLVGGTYQAWRWSESAGATHRCVRREYLSSEPVPGKPPSHVYKHYWALVDDDGLQIYTPCGARFAGFVA